MSGFNWFQRSYDKPQDTEAETQPPEKDTAEEQPATDAPSPEDYLKWARAAYQNIQRQQQESPTETADTAADTAADTVDEIVETQEPSGEKAAEEATGEAETVPSPAQEAQAPSPQPSQSAAAETAAPAASSQAGEKAPFWAQAEAERQARLERLRESAVVEEAAEPQPETAAQPEVLEFDEAFLWSAEVLAAQGRRPDQISAEEITWLNQLRRGLNKTRLGLVNQLKSIVGQGPLNRDAVDEIEALLLQADVGIEATDEIIRRLEDRLRQEALPPQQAIDYLKSILRDMLDQPLAGDHNMMFVPDHDCLNVWLMTGVNGAGKTTTIGKLAHIAKKSDYRCLIAAADTFRAAAVEQVKAWGGRSQVEVIANPGKNTDPAAVVYDAIAAAQVRQTELLLVDTAGRLQNKKNLMEELTKVRRIIDKKAPDAQVEALLVLDATLGQNGLQQARVFSEAVNLSGVVLTKLDGTAKGGVALAVVQQLGLPIRFIGAGEGIEDLRPFSSYEFVEALLSG